MRKFEFVKHRATGAHRRPRPWSGVAATSRRASKRRRKANHRHSLCGQRRAEAKWIAQIGSAAQAAARAGARRMTASAIWLPRARHVGCSAGGPAARDGGAVRLFQRQEIKDTIALLRCAESATRSRFGARAAAATGRRRDAGRHRGIRARLAAGGHGVAAGAGRAAAHPGGLQAGRLTIFDTKQRDAGLADRGRAAPGGSGRRQSSSSCGTRCPWATRADSAGATNICGNMARTRPGAGRVLAFAASVRVGHINFDISMVQGRPSG